MRVCLYARVSREDMHPENQFKPLLDWMKAAGAVQVQDADHPLGIFVDYVTSRDTRPKKEEVLKRMRLGTADGVAFYNLDRWGRSMGELVLELEEFLKSGRTMISVNEGIDYSTAIGRLHVHVIASFANFERDRISERTRLSLAARKAQGMILGRPVKSGARLSCGHSVTRLRGGKCRSCGAGESSPVVPPKVIEGEEVLGDTHVSPALDEWYCELDGYFENETGPQCPLCGSEMERR